MSDEARRLVCASCGETLGYEVPPGMELPAEADYSTRAVEVRCTARRGGGEGAEPVSVDDIDGAGTHIDELDPGRLANYLMMAAADVEKRARELVHASATRKRDAAQRLAEKAAEYVALCDRHALVRWGDWHRVEELRRVAKSLRELGEDVDADLYAARADDLAHRCFEMEPSGGLKP